LAAPLSLPFLRKDGTGGFASQGFPWFAFISGHPNFQLQLRSNIFFFKKQEDKKKKI